MEPATARIPVRSRRQAMEWSLVLVSQGIEPTIVEPEGDSGWALEVSEQAYIEALRTLRQYRVENRGWPWQQTVFKQGFLFDWGSFAWVLLVCLFYWLSSRAGLDPAGLMDSRAVAHGQWWRLFTAMWLHADLGHLAANASIGLLLLGLAMGRYGTGVGLLAAYLAGAGGNVIAGLVSLQEHRSLGASGMVTGCLGLLAVQSFSLWRQSPHAVKYILSGIFGGIMLFVLLALSPNSDVVAHLGGFGCGVLLGALLSVLPASSQRLEVNLVSGFLFALLVIVPWWLALRHPGA